MNENKYLYNSVKNSFIVALVLGLILMLYDFRYSLSIIVGLLFSTFNLVVYNYFFKSILSKKKFKPLNYVPVYLIINLSIIIPILLGIFMTSIFNLWFLVLGLLLNKIVLYVTSIMFKK